MRPNTLEMMTMRAASLALRSGRKARVIRTTPQKLTPNSHSKSSSAISSNAPPSATPALLTRRSTPACGPRISFGNAATACRSETSSRCRLAFAPALTVMRSVSMSPASSTSASARLQPRFASETAIPRPMPLAAPVTIAVRLLRFIRSGKVWSSRGPARLAKPLELERAVIDRAEAQGDDVEGVVLVHPPGLLRPLLRQQVFRSLDVARGEGQRRLVRHRRVAPPRGADRVAVAIHVVEEPAEVIVDQIGFEGPGGVRIAENRRQIRDVAEHHALVDRRAPHFDRLAVDLDLNPAHQPQLESGRGDDDVGFELLARRQTQGGLGGGFALAGDDRRLAGAQRREQVAVGDEAQTLVPGLVARVEVLGSVDP